MSHAHALAIVGIELSVDQMATLPVESLIFANQSGYDRAIQQSTDGGDSRPFVEFMLSIIRDTLKETPQVESLLRIIGERELSRSELQAKLKLKDAKNFRDGYLRPALEGGWIELTLPEKPNSPKQRCRAVRGNA